MKNIQNFRPKDSLIYLINCNSYVQVRSGCNIRESNKRNRSMNTNIQVAIENNSTGSSVHFIHSKLNSGSAWTNNSS